MEKSNTAHSTVVAFGEVLWDTYPSYRKLGGAPFNVLGHLRQFGYSTSMISRVGQERDGEEILKLIDLAGVDRSHIQLDAIHPTGRVNVSLDLMGKPTYEIVDPSAWDFIEVNDQGLAAVREAELFICGSLAARSATSRSSLITYLAASRYNVVDLNLRLDYFDESFINVLLQSADLLKINDEEFSVLTEMMSIHPDHFYPFLQSTYGIDVIIQTRGAHGAEGYQDGITKEHGGYSIDVVDTVGSGDAFLAGFLSKFLSNDGLEASLEFGCRMGAYVATQPGAIPRHDGNPPLKI